MGRSIPRGLVALHRRRIPRVPVFGRLQLREPGHLEVEDRAGRAVRLGALLDADHDDHHRLWRRLASHAGPHATKVAPPPSPGVARRRLAGCRGRLGPHPAPRLHGSGASRGPAALRPAPCSLWPAVCGLQPCSPAALQPCTLQPCSPAPCTLRPRTPAPAPLQVHRGAHHRLRGGGRRVHLRLYDRQHRLGHR